MIIFINNKSTKVGQTKLRIIKIWFLFFCLNAWCTRTNEDGEKARIVEKQQWRKLMHASGQEE